MVITNYHARILQLGEVKEKNGFKKCHILLETLEKKNEFDEVVYASEKFDAELAVDKEEKNYAEVKALGNSYFPATLNLRSFTYTEKDQQKLGKQLQLKRWAR